MSSKRKRREEGGLRKPVAVAVVRDNFGGVHSHNKKAKNDDAHFFPDHAIRKKMCVILRHDKCFGA
jgi:hypothetical protein